MSDFLATVALEPCRRRNIHCALRKLQRVRTSSGLSLLAPRRPQRRGAHRRDDHCVRQGCPRAPGRTNNDRQGRRHSRSTLPSVRIHFTARVRHSCSATVPWPSTRCTRNGAPCRPLSFTFASRSEPRRSTRPQRGSPPSAAIGPRDSRTWATPGSAEKMSLAWSHSPPSSAQSAGSPVVRRRALPAAACRQRKAAAANAGSAS